MSPLSEKANRALRRANTSQRKHVACVEFDDSAASEDDGSDEGSSGRAGVPAGGPRPLMTAYDEARLARLGEAAEGTAAVLAAARRRRHTLREPRLDAEAAAGGQGRACTYASALDGVDEEPCILGRESSRCILCGAKASTFNVHGISPDGGEILKPCVMCGSERRVQ